MEHQQAIGNLAVESYLLDQMTPQERDAFEEHYFECILCAEDIRAASKFIEDAREILREGPAPQHATTVRQATPAPYRDRAPDSSAGRTVRDDTQKDRWRWLAWLKPQFAAPALAALLVLVGIQALRTIPNLKNQVEEASAPRLVASAFLRPGTRGDPPRILVAPQSPLLLSLDLPGALAGATPLQFVIESADGKEELRVDGEAPEPGLPVNLMIPRMDLPAGLYTLVAEHDATAAARGLEVARFPFELERQ
jgi:hypothetical protein